MAAGAGITVAVYREKWNDREREIEAKINSMTTQEPVYYDCKYIDPSYIKPDYLWTEVINRGGSDNLKEVPRVRTGEEIKQMEWEEIRAIVEAADGRYLEKNLRYIEQNLGRKKRVRKATLQAFRLLMKLSLNFPLLMSLLMMIPNITIHVFIRLSTK